MEACLWIYKDDHRQISFGSETLQSKEGTKNQQAHAQHQTAQ